MFLLVQTDVAQHDAVGLQAEGFADLSRRSHLDLADQALLATTPALLIAWRMLLAAAIYSSFVATISYRPKRWFLPSPSVAAASSSASSSSPARRLPRSAPTKSTVKVCPVVGTGLKGRQANEEAATNYEDDIVKQNGAMPYADERRL